jgi:secretion/DNA translocation related TadE-like protein
VSKGTSTGRTDGGSASVLMIGVMAVVMLISFAAMVVAGYLVSVHRARGAADLAALSGAAAYQQGQDACPAARQAARRNGGAVVDCSQVGDLVDFVVSVRVRMDVQTWIPGLPSSVVATAHAGPVA